jgi:histidyl-tRNA synthetase
MKTGTVKGTNDYLPADAALREFIQNSILETYRINGYERIITPALEDIENLDKSEGGENLNLIFRILKRGDKLKHAIENSLFEELSDTGLRYDLTLPLSRYYASNRQNLLLPFKCIQIGSVYRAERPQKGRLREFVQCDIDIIGSNSAYCEAELIHVTSKALLAVGIKNFIVKINDRNILKDVLLSIGYEMKELDSVCITFDKLDKIGADGVRDELLSKGFDLKKINALASILKRSPVTLDYIKTVSSDTESIHNLEKIISAIRTLSENKYDIVFDFSLVRGQGYYTGTVFEIVSGDFNGSIAGGGRYDGLIGKFTGEKVPAVGFSIGFERIFRILKDSNYLIPGNRRKLALFYEDDFLEAYRQADKLRASYDVALFERPKKLAKFLDLLQEDGFYGFLISGQSEDIKILG